MPWEFFSGRLPSPGLAAIIPFANDGSNIIRVLDLSLHLEAPELKLKDELEIFNPDLIAISGTKSAFAYETVNVAEFCRLYAPGAMIAGGGNFLSNYAEDAVSRGYLDFIIKGEGELTFKELAGAIKSRKYSGLLNIKGLAYAAELVNSPQKYYSELKAQFAENLFNKGRTLFFKNRIFAKPEKFKTLYTQDRSLIENLDVLPLPAYEHFDMDKYELKPLGGRSGFVISFSRGCGNCCSFCADSVFWRNRWRGFSAGRCIELLKLLKNVYGRSIFYFGDDDFLWDRGRNIEFLELLENIRTNENFKINFWIQSSVANILKNTDLLKRFRQAGLYQIMCGFESVNPGAQESFKKKNAVADMIKVSKLLKKHGILLMGMMMWGDRHDDESTLTANLDFMVKHCDVIGPNTVVPHYGTGYFDEYERRGLVNKYSVLGNDQCDVLMPTETLTISEADAVYKDKVLKILISKKKFIGNYFQAKNKRTRDVLGELIENGYRTDLISL